MVVTGIEKPKPEDQSIVFHLLPIHKCRNDITKENYFDEVEKYILSAEFIVDHEYWTIKDG